MTTAPLAEIGHRDDVDLVLERTVDVRTALVWRAWTEPEELMAWWTPLPYRTVACDIDLRPGGIFRTRMRSPEGDESDQIGCYLEVVPQRRLVWTTALGPGFQPTAGRSPFQFTAFITLDDRGDGTTRYTARARHSDAAERARHDEMGFHEGWGTVLDQLVALAKKHSC